MSEVSEDSGAPAPPTAGTSINFDAHALHEKEEAEYRQEEQDRQNELRELLTNAFDDISDEDDLDFANTSQLSQEQTTLHPTHDTPSPSPTGHDQHNEYPWHHKTQWTQGYDKTNEPANVYPANTEPVEQFHDDAKFHLENTDDAPYNMYSEAQGEEYQAYWNPGGEAMDYGERGEVEGGNEESNYYDNHAAIDHYQYMTGPQYDTVPYHMNQAAVASHMTQAPVGGHMTQAPVAGHMTQAPVAGHMTQAPVASHMTQASVGGHMTQAPVGGHMTQAPVAGHMTQALVGGHMTQAPVAMNIEDNQHLATNPPLISKKMNPDISPDHHELGWAHSRLNGSGDGDDYKVKYAPKTEAVNAKRQTEGAKQSEAKPGQYQHMGDDYLAHTGSGDSRQLAQLRILYEARGRKISELTQEVDELNETKDREIRILKHKLTLTEDEKDGMSVSLEQNQRLLEESQHRETTLSGKMAALVIQMDALKTAKSELVKKLQTAESTIESLNIQLNELGASESLSRAQQQHEATLSAMKHRHEEQVFSLQATCDTLQAERNKQDDEVRVLRQRVSELTRAAEEGHIDRADTINRLSRSLEESQRQCRELLESGAGMEVSKLKISLQDAIAARSIAEDMNSALQDALKDTKEQVMMYESASFFGVLPSDGMSSQLPSLSTDLDDSYAQLGIKRPLNKTPHITSSGSSDLSPEETVQGLKSELERCLGLYRSKRQLVDKLTNELKESKESAEEHRLQAAELRTQADQTKSRVNELEQKLGLHTTDTHAERLEKEKDKLSQQLQEMKVRLEEAAANEEKLTELNCELSRQMTQLIHDFDQDKKEALEACRETCLTHTDQTKAMFRSELEQEFEKERTKLEQTITSLREEIESCQREVEDTKQAFVEVCEEKSQVEEALHSAQLQQEKIMSERQEEKNLKEEVDRLTVELQEQATRAEQDLQQALTDKQQEMEQQAQLQLTQAESRWREEGKEESAREVMAVVAEARATWESTVLTPAVENARQQWLTSELPTIKQGWIKTELAKEVGEIEIEKTALEEKLVHLTAEKNALDEKLLKITAEKDELTEKLINITADKDDLAKKLSSIVAEKDDLCKKLTADKDEFDKKLTSITAEKDDLDRKLTNIAFEKDDLEKKLSSIRAEKDDLDKKLSSITAEKDDLDKKLSSIIAEKDAERRRAVSEVEAQCEADYSHFIQEHQHTLDKSLKSLRAQFAQEKEALAVKHQQELIAAQKTGASVKCVEEARDEERKKWADKLEALNKLHEEEKSEMVVQHEQELAEKLEKAEEQWLQVIQMRVSEGEDKVRRESDEHFQSRTAELQARLAQHELLFASADSHMETQLKALQQQVLSEHSEQLDQQLSAVEQRYSSQLNEATEQVDQLVNQLEDMHADMQALYARYTTDMTSLNDKLDHAEDKFGVLQNAHQTWLEHKSQLEQHIEDLEQKIEEDQNKYEATQQERCELAGKLQKTEAKLKQMSSNQESQIAAVQEAMEREHGVAMEAMKRGLLKLQEDHGKKVEEQRRRYLHDREKLKRIIRELQLQKRECSSTPVQTDSFLDPPTVNIIQQQYLDAVKKIRGEVMAHMEQSNQQAARRVREEVVRERRSTARRLKRHYIKCMRSMLTAVDSSGSQPDKMAAMRQYLDQLAEHSTPSDLTPSEVTTSLPTPSDLSPTGFPSYTKPPSTTHSTTHSATHHHSQVSEWITAYCSEASPGQVVRLPSNPPLVSSPQTGNVSLTTSSDNTSLYFGLFRGEDLTGKRVEKSQSSVSSQTTLVTPVDDRSSQHTVTSSTWHRTQPPVSTVTTSLPTNTQLTSQTAEGTAQKAFKPFKYVPLRTMMTSSDTTRARSPRGDDITIRGISRDTVPTQPPPVMRSKPQLQNPATSRVLTSKPSEVVKSHNNVEISRHLAASARQTSSGPQLFHSRPPPLIGQPAKSDCAVLKPKPLMASYQHKTRQK